jgi:hypothetical protein
MDGGDQLSFVVVVVIMMCTAPGTNLQTVDECEVPLNYFSLQNRMMS